MQVIFCLCARLHQNFCVCLNELWTFIYLRQAPLFRVCLACVVTACLLSSEIYTNGHSLKSVEWRTRGQKSLEHPVLRSLLQNIRRICFCSPKKPENNAKPQITRTLAGVQHVSQISDITTMKNNLILQRKPMSRLFPCFFANQEKTGKFIKS